MAYAGARIPIHVVESLRGSLCNALRSAAFTDLTEYEDAVVIALSDLAKEGWLISPPSAAVIAAQASKDKDEARRRKEAIPASEAALDAYEVAFGSIHDKMKPRMVLDDPDIGGFGGDLRVKVRFWFDTAPPVPLFCGLHHHHSENSFASSLPKPGAKTNRGLK